MFAAALPAAFPPDEHPAFSASPRPSSFARALRGRRGCPEPSGARGPVEAEGRRWKAGHVRSVQGQGRGPRFWATWCPPCKAEIPGYVALQKKYGADGLVIVGVSLDTGGTAEVKQFIKDFGINYPVVMGDDDIVNAFAPIDGYPTTFIIDRDGLIRNKKLGKKLAADFERDVLAVLRPLP